MSDLQYGLILKTLTQFSDIAAKERELVELFPFFSCNSCKWPTWRTITLFYHTCITVLYMFREKSCSSSGGQIVLIQHLVSSISLSGRPVCRSRFTSRPAYRKATYREWLYQMLY